MMTDAERERRREEMVERQEARAQMEARLGALERAVPELQLALVEAMRSVTDIFDKMGDQRAGLASGQMNELRELRIEVAKLRTVCAEMREKQVETFRFARERETLPPVLPKTPKLDS
jgi:chromosome segregation ATPase